MVPLMTLASCACMGTSWPWVEHHSGTGNLASCHTRGWRYQKARTANAERWKADCQRSEISVSLRGTEKSRRLSGGPQRLSRVLTKHVSGRTYPSQLLGCH